METAAISYRIVDFLKKYPPFSAVDESDLLALTADGRVRFYEANDYLLWQGEPHKMHVFVIQQGTVSMWDDTGAATTLTDVRGVGDLLGVERFNGSRSCAFSAKAESDVLVYGFSEADFDALVDKYPHVRQYVGNYSGGVGFQASDGPRDPVSLFLHEIIGARTVVSCPPQATIADAVQRMIDTDTEALAMLDATRRPAGVVTAKGILEWVATGGGDARQSAAVLVHRPVTVGPDTTVADATLTFAEVGADVLTLTADGTANGEVQALVTPRDLAPAFGDQPGWIVQQIETADETSHLRYLNARARAFVARHLSGPAAVDWLARFTQIVDAAIVRRLCTLMGADLPQTCWCLSGAAGRGESLTLLGPQLVVIVEQDRHVADAARAYDRVCAGLDECGFLPRETPFDRAFYVASTGEWQSRFDGWVRNPVLTQMYQARPLFDLRAIAGAGPLRQHLADTVSTALDTTFLRVLANDCLANLPPLTFFRDAVVEESGEQTTVFRLERSALRPLVDVGRVFGLASRLVFNGSTLQRLGSGRNLVPEREGIFREAAEAFRVVLWQQGRVGIDQGTGGFELPPTLLSRNDRQTLKGGFRSIARLLEFTADFAWLEHL